MKITSVIISICLCICCLYDSLASDAVISLPPLSPGEASVCISKADRSLSFKRSKEVLSDTPLHKQIITINPKIHFQPIDGFVAALTGSTCYNLMQMSTQDRSAFLKQTFSPNEGLGFSYVRISIGCSDFSLSEYTCCDTPGIENFSLQQEEQLYIIPVLKEILLIRPDLKIMGSPWTSPRWMKVNNLKELKPFNSWTSGQLNPKYYQDYALYFVKWIQAFQNHGISIYSITPQNEPLNRGNSASLFMGWEEQLQFIKTALGPALRNAKLQTKIYAFDHNYNYDNMSDQKGYPLKLYSDPQASSFLAGAAFHNYGGNRQELNLIHNASPDKELIFTETSIGRWNDGRNLAKRLIDDMREVALGTINNHCCGVIVWNLMLDSERGPNRPGGCQICYGAVDIEKSDYKTIRFNSHYYIIGHLSIFVEPGAFRIEHSAIDCSGIILSSFLNPDDTLAVALLNENDTEIPLSLTSKNKQYLNITLPPRSVTSCRWNPNLENL